ncbi:MAG: hypothetical protein E4G99_01150 [Anaerolineales bacterium]|nr:MAG: hypothetical protein E4G99_01150 [Anaerolineales bacterium]
MSFTVLIHVAGEEAVLGEVDELPSTQDNLITINNPRRRDEKDLAYLHETVTTVIWPMWRINFIEIMPTREDEDLIGFVRE